MITLVVTVASFLLFGFATDAHHRRQLGMSPPVGRSQNLRRAAWALLALSVLPALQSHGWIFGIVFWSGSIMAGAGVAFLLLNLQPAFPHKLTRTEQRVSDDGSGQHRMPL